MYYKSKLIKAQCITAVQVKKFSNSIKSTAAEPLLFFAGECMSLPTDSLLMR